MFEQNRIELLVRLYNDLFHAAQVYHKALLDERHTSPSRGKMTFIFKEAPTATSVHVIVRH
jgi:hypothetical protein